MKNVLSLDKTPSALERFVKAATKLKSELPTDLQMENIPLRELSSLTEEGVKKAPTLTCESSLGLTRPYKAYRVSS